MTLKTLTCFTLALSLTVLTACESTPTTPGTAEISAPFIHATLKWGQHTLLTIGQPPLDCWTVTLAGRNGKLQEVAGNGPTSLQIPPGMTRVAVLQYPCPAAPAPPADLSHGQMDARLHGTAAALHGMPVVLPEPGEISTFYSLTADHPHPEDAAALMAQTAASGAGALVPNAVTVHAMVEAWLTTDGLLIETSLPERFESFRVLADEQVLADAGRGLNVAASTTDNGWSTLTTVIPLDVLESASSILVQQEGRIAAVPYEAGIQL